MLVTSLPSFHVDELPGFYTNPLPGLHSSPSLWTDNDPNIIRTYNEKKHLTAYIEDYYQPTTPEGSNATENIQWKYNAQQVTLSRRLLSTPTASSGLGHQVITQTIRRRNGHGSWLLEMAR
jgi:1-phosphatidylinositol phosphodiesterase